MILTREHCIVDKTYKVVCRNKELFLEGRQLKNVLFVASDAKDACLTH